LNKQLTSTLPVIKDVITDSIFPENELETFVRNQQQKLQVSLQKNDVVARRTFNKAIYGNTIYGLGAEFSDYKTLHRDDMLWHFKQMYQPSNCTIIVAGKVDKKTLDMLTASFGSSWTNPTVEANSSQPVLKPAKEHADFPALQVTNTLLGGYFGSRLMNNIREDKGYTYGIGSGVSSLKHGGALFIATEVGADVCKAAIVEIEKEIKLLKTELVSEDELSLVRNYMLGSLLGSLENVMSHADKFKNIYFAGLDYDYYERYTQVIRSFTAEEVLQTANKYLEMDKFYKVIVGKY